MNTILYRISAKYFPGVKLSQPFHAKVNYSVTGGKVKIEDVAFSEKCLVYMREHHAFVKELKEILQKSESKVKVAQECNVHPTILNAITPHLSGTV